MRASSAQSAKARAPIEPTVEGMRRPSIAVPSNASAPIDSSPSERETAARDEHPENAASPTDLTDEGTLTDSMDEQPSKARSATAETGYVTPSTSAEAGISRFFPGPSSPCQETASVLFASSSKDGPACPLSCGSPSCALPSSGASALWDGPSPPSGSSPAEPNVSNFWNPAFSHTALRASKPSPAGRATRASRFTASANAVGSMSSTEPVATIDRSVSAPANAPAPIALVSGGRTTASPMPDGA